MHSQSLHTPKAPHTITIHLKYGLQVKFLQTFGLIEQTSLSYNLPGRITLYMNI